MLLFFSRIPAGVVHDLRSFVNLKKKCLSFVYQISSTFPFKQVRLSVQSFGLLFSIHRMSLSIVKSLHTKEFGSCVSGKPADEAHRTQWLD